MACARRFFFPLVLTALRPVSTRGPGVRVVGEKQKQRQSGSTSKRCPFSSPRARIRAGVHEKVLSRALSGTNEGAPLRHSTVHTQTHARIYRDTRVHSLKYIDAHTERRETRGGNLCRAQQAPDLWELFGPRASHDTLRLLAGCVRAAGFTRASLPLSVPSVPVADTLLPVADTLLPVKSPQIARKGHHDGTVGGRDW